MNLAYTLKSKGRHMSRQRFQRPEVRKMGSGRKQQWGCDYFVYVKDEHGAADSQGWALRLMLPYQKGQGAGGLRSLHGHVNSGVAFADASMILAEWWENVFKPIRGRQWLYNTRIGYESTWRRHIEPHVGKVKLADLNKIEFDRLLLRSRGQRTQPADG